MKPHPLQTPGLRVPALAAFALAAALPALPAFAQEAPPDAAALPAAAPAIQFRVEAERSVPIEGGGRLILQRVAQPVLPPPPVVVPRTVLSPEERAARLAARRAVPMPKQTSLLWFHVTVHEGGLSYIEWWPDGGGGPYAAWSRADFRYMSMIPDFDVENTDTRYLVFPSVILRPRPGSTPVPHPAIPADGPGFVLVKGDPANTRAVAPIAAMHRLYEEEFESFKANYEQRETARVAAAALPPPPPGDVVIQFWPLRSEAAAPAASQTPTPAAP